MSDDPASGIGCGLLAAMLVMMALVVFFEEPSSPWPDTSNGAVVTVVETEYESSSGETFGGDTFVAVLDSTWAGLSELFAVLCGGGIAMWAVFLLLVIVGLAGIGAAAG